MCIFHTFAPLKWGALIGRAEIKPFEPDTGNSDAGKANISLHFLIKYIIMKRTYLFLILLFTVYASYSQYNISGKIITEKGVSLVGANILIPEINKAVSSDDNGYFEFNNLKKDSYNIQASYIGYKVKSTNINVFKDVYTELILLEQSFVTNIIHVEGLRATENTPVSYTMLEKEKIKEKNLGRDIPYMISMTPSAVASSDAGAGIGYSSISIRGSGAKRINVTIDGVPINDPESHSVYWVNMPDLLSSIDNIQVQRGVGTSTNGVGAFGASINFRTENPSKEAYGSISSSIGSLLVKTDGSPPYSRYLSRSKRSPDEIISGYTKGFKN